MNYLAHFHFCNAQEGLVVGALLGDFIKGPLSESTLNSGPVSLDRADLSTNTKQIVAGIQFHRDIDAYFDTLAREILFINSHTEHPLKQLQTPRGRRYFPIALDLIFDYALSVKWAELESQSIAAFNERTLNSLSRYRGLFPENAQRLVDRLQQHSLLTRYNDKSLLRDICRAIAGRMSRRNTLLETFDEVWRHEQQLIDFFDVAYPQIKQFSTDWQQRNL